MQTTTDSDAIILRPTARCGGAVNYRIHHNGAMHLISWDEVSDFAAFGRLDKRLVRMIEREWISINPATREVSIGGQAMILESPNDAWR